MFNDSRIVLPKLSKPVSFGALMSLYESNYVRLLELFDLPRSKVNMNSQLWGNNEYRIKVTVEEVTKYTALICIDEDYLTAHEPVRMNHFRVRLYYDAQVATVQSSLHASDQYSESALPIDKTRITELWQQNMFFNKWLEFCSVRGLRMLNK